MAMFYFYTFFNEVNWCRALNWSNTHAERNWTLPG